MTQNSSQSVYCEAHQCLIDVFILFYSQYNIALLASTTEVELKQKQK